MISRAVTNQIRVLLGESPIVAILGARQVGKTTLAREVAATWGGPVYHFDLEDPADIAALQEPGLALRPLTGLVVLDEIQRQPQLFSLLRVLADRVPASARFLLLGSASPDVVRGVSESLAGRVAFVDLRGFGVDEVGEEHLQRLWIRGGFPRSFLASTDDSSERWRRDFVRTFLERDLALLRPGISPAGMRQLWTMLAHHHGQVLNASAIGRGLGVGEKAVRGYVDLLEGTYMVERLRPWFENVAKRQVKRPKIYIADTGLLHTLLGLGAIADVARHPILGASWEGFALQQTIRRVGAERANCYFWATHAGAELDLLVVQGGKRIGFEFKRTDSPRRTRSMHAATTTLGLDVLYVVHGGERTFELGEGTRAVALSRLFRDLPVL